jgi:hypothetical protein
MSIDKRPSHHPAPSKVATGEVAASPVMPPQRIRASRYVRYDE